LNKIDKVKHYIKINDYNPHDEIYINPTVTPIKENKTSEKINRTKHTRTISRSSLCFHLVSGK